MDYRFEISKPDSNDFRCEIAINGEQTFQQLHDKLVETLNFDGRWPPFLPWIKWETGEKKLL